MMRCSICTCMAFACIHCVNRVQRTVRRPLQLSTIRQDVDIDIDIDIEAQLSAHEAAAQDG
jgi:hypothetical protein